MKLKRKTSSKIFIFTIIMLSSIPLHFMGGLFNSDSEYEINLVPSQFGDIDDYVDAIDASVWGTTENFGGMMRDNEDFAVLYEQFISPILPYFYLTQIYRFDHIITTFDMAILNIDFMSYTPSGLDVYVGPSPSTQFRIGQLINPGLISFDISSLLLSTPFFLKITDSDNPSNLGPYQIRRMYISLIGARNNIPVVDAGTDQSSDEGAIVSFSGSFSDEDAGDSHYIHWNFGDGSETSGSLTPTHTYDDNGIYTATLTVSDNHGGMDSDSVTVSVNNLAPSADAGNDQIVDEGELVSFAGSLSDSGVSDTHTFEWDFGDGNYASGSLTPSHSYGDNGDYTVTLTVTDDDGDFGSDSLIISVNNLGPVVTAVEDQFVTEGIESSLVLANFFNPGSLDTHSAIVDWGDGYVGSAQVVEVAPDTLGTISGVHTYMSSGQYMATITVTDDDGGEGSDTLQINVENQAPTVDAGPDQTIDEGQWADFIGSFSDYNSGQTFTIHWDFGDGNSISDTLTPTHFYDDSGIYTVTLSVTDEDGAVGTDSLVVTVNNVAPTVDIGEDQTVNEGEIVNFQASFVDPGVLDLYTVEWDFGDGYVGSGTLTPRYSYLDNGIYTVTLTITDDEGGVGSDSSIITVLNVAPVVDAGADQIGNEGDNILFSGSFTDQGISDTHTIDWNFGDGDIALGSLTPMHSYGDNGVYTVTLTITDDDGAATSENLQITINNVAPSVDAGADQTINEGEIVNFQASFNDPGFLDTHTIEWAFGDGDFDSGTLSPRHSYLDDGVYTAILTITDDEGDIGTDSLSITVLNLAPIASAGEDQIGDEGDDMNFAGTFTDQGISDTHTIDWDFGDGNYASGTLTPTHSYGDDGIYTVSLTVTDDDGGTDSSTLLVTLGNLAPIVDAGMDAEINVGVSFEFSGAFVDPGYLDTHTIEWAFGDGTTESGMLNPTHIYDNEGSYIVILTITDDEGAVGTDSLNIEVIAQVNNPRVLKTETIEILEDAKTGDEYIDKKINLVINIISHSLCEYLWIDDSHLNPRYGCFVFFLEMIAISIMLEYPDVDAFQIVIGKLVEVDLLLANIALEEAENKEVKNPEFQEMYDYCIQKANIYMNEVETKLQEGKYTCAVFYMLKAWKFAQFAINWANREDCCFCCCN